MIDSGLKTVRAVVTDANGRTAETTVKVYVILSIGDSGAPLTAGQTYKVEGHLLTIPEGVRASIGVYEVATCEGAPCQSTFGINLEGDDFVGSIRFGVGDGRALPRRFFRLTEGARGASEEASRRQEIVALFDELANSAGVRPTGEGD